MRRHAQYRWHAVPTRTRPRKCTRACTAWVRVPTTMGTQEWCITGRHTHASVESNLACGSLCSRARERTRRTNVCVRACVCAPARLHAYCSPTSLSVHLTMRHSVFGYVRRSRTVHPMSLRPADQVLDTWIIIERPPPLESSGVQTCRSRTARSASSRQRRSDSSCSCRLRVAQFGYCQMRCRGWRGGG